MTEGLAETQVEKLKALSEHISYDSVNDYKNKLSVIKETYFPTSRKPATEATILTEEFASESENESSESEEESDSSEEIKSSKRKKGKKRVYSTAPKQSKLQKQIESLRAKNKQLQSLFVTTKIKKARKKYESEGSEDEYQEEEEEEYERPSKRSVDKVPIERPTTPYFFC